MRYFGNFAQVLLAGRFFRSLGTLRLVANIDRKQFLSRSRLAQKRIAKRHICTIPFVRMSGVIDLTSDDKDKAQQSPVQLGSDGELDDNLKLAIAMSLQSQQSPTKPASAAAEATTDDSDGEVEKAIALSLQHEEGSTAAPTRSGQPQGKHEQTSTQVLSVSSTGGILGLDRKAMEAERLARLKRKRGPEPRSSSPPAKRISPPPLRRDRTATTTAAFPLSTKPHATSKSRSTNPFSFTTPRVLLTSHPSRHASHGLAAISLRDAISPPTPNLTLKSVLASSFIIDFDWLLPHFNTATTKFIFVLHAQNDQHRALLQRDFSGVPNVRLVMPECLGGGGNMHSKLLLLFFQGEKGGSGGEEVCRVVVPSANLIAADWGVGGVMENVLFVVDSPLKSTTEISDGETQFKREIKKQLREMGVADDVLRKLDKFDFGATKDVGFVHSMSGSRLLQSESGSLPKQKSFFASKSATTRKDALPNIPEEAQQHPSTPTQNDITRTGLLSLHDTIQSLNLSVSPTDPSYPPDLDFITSSLGNLATPFIRQLYQAACGHLDPTSIASSTARKRGKPAPNTDTTLDSLIKQNLRIYFPTSETVAKSKGGPNQAGTICFQKKWWETNESIRDVLCDCVGVRDDGILMHSKVCAHHFLHSFVALLVSLFSAVLHYTAPETPPAKNRRYIYPCLSADVLWRLNSKLGQAHGPHPGCFQGYDAGLMQACSRRGASLSACFPSAWRRCCEFKLRMEDVYEQHGVFLIR